MEVSVIIVSYNTANLLVDTIESVLLRTEGVDFEVIVVDNNSGDNSAELVVETFGDRVKVLRLHQNLGFGNANNEGAKLANGKFLFFLNPDTILLNNSVKILSDFLNNNSSVGICGGNLFTKDLEPTHSGMPVLPSILLELDSLLLHIILKIGYGKKFDFNVGSKPKKMAHITGADLMIRKNLFADLGGFDSDFFLYFEETELSYRVAKSGYSIYSVPQAKIIHLEGKSSDSDISRRKYSLISRKIYYKKTTPLFKRMIIDLIFLPKCMVGIVVSALRFNRRYVEYWFYALKKGMIEIW